MQKIVEFKVSGTLSKKRVYLNDDEIIIDPQGRGKSKPQPEGFQAVVSYSGIGFSGASIKIEMTPAFPDVITDSVPENASVLVGQCSITVN